MQSINSDCKMALELAHLNHAGSGWGSGLGVYKSGGPEMGRVNWPDQEDRYIVLKWP